MEPTQNCEGRLAIGANYRGGRKKRRKIDLLERSNLAMLHVQIPNLGKSLGAQQLLGHILRRDADAAALAEPHGGDFEAILPGHHTRCAD
jgi:hypothetical protein